MFVCFVFLMVIPLHSISSIVLICIELSHNIKAFSLTLWTVGKNDIWFLKSEYWSIWKGFDMHNLFQPKCLGCCSLFVHTISFCFLLKNLFNYSIYIWYALDSSDIVSMKNCNLLWNFITSIALFQSRTSCFLKIFKIIEWKPTITRILEQLWQWPTWP